MEMGQADEVKVIYGRIIAKLHACQTGIAHLISLHENRGEQWKAATPKHLRVGVDNALMEISAIQAVLYEKGITTPVEFYSKLEELVDAEMKRYTDEVRKAYGSDAISLG